MFDMQYNHQKPYSSQSFLIYLTKQIIFMCGRLSFHFFQLYNMYSYSYNMQNPSISRLDQLLNRNELIYQNLKQKLDGINRSNQNIYRNISHIQTSYHDPFSQESSAIQREPTIRNTSIRLELEDSPRRYHPQGLEKIDQHQQVTFSEENNLETEEEERNRRIIQEEQRLYELQVMLEKERILEEERLIELETLRRHREEMDKQRQRQGQVRAKNYQKQRRREQEDKGNESERRKENANSGQLSDRSRKSFILPKSQRQSSRNAIKNNSIYLSQIPKTSIIDAEEEIPTFRQAFSKRKQIHQQQEDERQRSQSSHRAKSVKPDQPLKESVTDRHKRKELNEVSLHKNNQIVEEKPKRIQNKRQFVEIQDDAIENDPLDASNIIHDTHDDLNFQNMAARSQPRRDNPTPYSQLNSHFKTKLEQIQLVAECILFAPFNKVYRSPILQLKPGCITLERKSKTSSLTTASNRMRIVDGFKYKFKTVMTDQQLLLKYLFCSDDTLNFEKRECNKIAIVGGRESLKKKLHMGLLAYCHQQLGLEVNNTHRSILIKLEHQSITPNQEPFLLQSTIQADPSSRRLALMKLQKMVNDIHDVIKKFSWGKSGKKILRMTKLVVASEGQTSWSCNIISSNRYDYDFLRHLRVNKLCWSINPLVKYYDQVKQTLQSMRHYIANRKTA